MPKSENQTTETTDPESQPTPEEPTLPPMGDDDPVVGDPSRSHGHLQKIQQEQAQQRKQMELLTRNLTKLTQQLDNQQSTHAKATASDLNVDLGHLDDDDLVDGKSLKQIVSQIAQGRNHHDPEILQTLVQKVDQLNLQQSTQYATNQFWAEWKHKNPGIDGPAIWADLENEARAMGFSSPQEIRAFCAKPFSQQIEAANKDLARKTKAKESKTVKGAETQTPGATTATPYKNEDVQRNELGIPIFDLSPEEPE